MKVKPNQYTGHFTRAVFSSVWQTPCQDSKTSLIILQPINNLTTLGCHLYCVSTLLSWADTQIVYLISVEVIPSLGDLEVTTVSKCTLKKKKDIVMWRSGGWVVYKEWGRGAGKKWKRATLPATNEAAPSQPCPRLLITRKVHVLMGSELFHAAPTPVFSRAEQPHHKRESKYFSLRKKNGSIVAALILAP